jgi:hypothetical protein
MRRPTPSLPGLTRQSILLRKKMDARIKPAHDGSAMSAIALGRREFVALIGAAPRKRPPCGLSLAAEIVSRTYYSGYKVAADKKHSPRFLLSIPRV